MQNNSIFRTATNVLDLSPSFDKAHVYLPSCFCDKRIPIASTLGEISNIFPSVNTTHTNIPTLVLLPGSMGMPLDTEKKIRERCCEINSIALITLNTHAIENRPKYLSPASREVYEEIHRLRVAEVDQFINRLSDIQWVDESKMILMGISEGAVAAATYQNFQFGLRIISSWSCEENYFTEKFKLGGDLSTWFLNIIGYQDQFFGVNADLSAGNKVTGHGSEILKLHPYSKIVILPKARHRIFEDSPLALQEITSFIGLWLFEMKNRDSTNKTMNKQMT
ncbi:MAG: hypothetical protein ACI82S_001023 [Patiriisocius sp.]|jgi:hypothetical protein